MDNLPNSELMGKMSWGKVRTRERIRKRLLSVQKSVYLMDTYTFGKACSCVFSLPGQERQDERPGAGRAGARASPDSVPRPSVSLSLSTMSLCFSISAKDWP